MVKVKRMWKLLKLFFRALPVVLHANDVRAISITLRGVNPTFFDVLITPDYIYIKNRSKENPEA